MNVISSWLKLVFALLPYLGREQLRAARVDLRLRQALHLLRESGNFGHLVALWEIILKFTFFL
jgi:hypothetical protein